MYLVANSCWYLESRFCKAPLRRESQALLRKLPSALERSAVNPVVLKDELYRYRRVFVTRVVLDFGL